MLAEILQNFSADLLLIGIPIAYLFFEKGNLKKALHGIGFSYCPLKKLAKKTIALFAILAIASFSLGLLLQLAGINDLQNVEKTIQGMKIFPLFFWPMAIRAAGEEVFFRGFLTTKIGPAWSTVIFASFHALYFSAGEVAGALLLGFILAKAFQLNKNLYPNIMAHAGYNALAMALV